MNKYLKYLGICAAVVATGALTACSDDDDLGPKDKIDYSKNWCYLQQPGQTFAHVEYKANGQMLIDIDDPLAVMPVKYTKAPTSDVQVKVEIDPTVIDEYNEENGTDYVLLTGASIVNPLLTIKKGEYASTEPITVTFGDKTGFQTGEGNFILPLVIKSAPGASISKSSRIFLTFTSDYKANFVTLHNYKLSIDNDVPGWDTEFSTLTIDNFATTSWAADDAITMNLAIDNSLIADYNAAMGTNCEALTGAQLATTTLNIGEGADNASLVVKLGDYTGVAQGKEYVIPVKVATFDGFGAELNGGNDVAYIYVRPFEPTFTVGYEPIGTQLYSAEWTCIRNASTTVSSLIFQETERSGYQYSVVGDVFHIDLKNVTEIQTLGFCFYAWYYAWGDVIIRTSEDGVNWLEWTKAANTNDMDDKFLYLTLAKKTNARYVDLQITDYYYYSGMYVKNFWFFN